MSTFSTRNKDEKLYNIYNGFRDTNKYKSITETYGIEFPVGKLKRIPLVRPLLHRLAGQQQDRPWGTIVRASDTDAIDVKKQDMSNGILNDVIEGIKSQDTTSIDVFLDKVNKYWGEDFQTDFEIGAFHVLEDYRLKYDLEQKFWDAFVDKEITGKQHYYCRVNRLGEAPEFKIVRPGTLAWSDESVKWIRECGWAVHCVRMAPSEVIDRWGDRMSPEEIKRLSSWSEIYSHDNFKVYSPEEIDTLLYRDSDSFNSQTSSWYDKINVYFVEWTSERKVNILRSPNKHEPEAPFIKHIKEDELHELAGARKKNLDVRYVQDLYQGVRVGDDMYLDLGKVKYPRRNAQHPSRVYLSFNGLTYNGKIKPFSLVEVTEDLQDLYDIMHFHKENLVAMSGTKGSYMDLSQLPDFGMGSFKENLKMWMYYKKMGTAFVQRDKESADKNFNQFPSYNDTIDQSLSVVLEMIKHIEETAGRIVSVNRQQMGDVSQYDGKETTNSAIQNSSLSTVPLFNEHDEFTRMACEDIVNACKVTYPKGTKGSYMNNQFIQTIFNVDPEFSCHDYNVYFTNRFSDQKAISDIRAWAYKLLDSQMIQFEDILPLFRKSNLKDIEVTIRKSIDERRKAAAEQNRQIQQLQQQLMVAKEQGEIGKLQAEIKQLEAKADRLIRESELEEKALDLEAHLEGNKLDNDTRRVDLESKEIDATLQQKKAIGSNRSEVKNK